MGKVGWCGLQKSPVTGNFSQPGNCDAIQYESFSPVTFCPVGHLFLMVRGRVDLCKSIHLRFLGVLEYSFLLLLWKSIPYAIDDHGLTLRALTDDFNFTCFRRFWSCSCACF